MKTIVRMLLFLAPFVVLGQITQIGEDIYGEAAGDYFGAAVSMNASGNFVAIGAFYNSANGEWAGHVRVYENMESTWTQIGQDIDGEAAFDLSGSSVSLSADGTIVAIGAPWNNGNGTHSGHVRVYENHNGNWLQIGQDINGEAAEDRSGGSVSLNYDGTVVAIGAPWNGDNGDLAGHVRIYENMGGTWTQVGQDIDGEAASDESGISVSLSADGSIVAIGAYLNDGNGTDSGHVRVYRNNGGTWTQIGQDIDGEAENDSSGWSVSLSADGSTVAIGAPWNNDNGTKAGHVRVYENMDETWTQLGEDIDGEAMNDWSGSSVNLNADGTILAIGALLNDGNGSDSGHARIYKYHAGTWTQIGQDIDGEAANDSCGSSVSLNDNGRTVAIGSPRNNGDGSMAGQVRVFDLSSVLGYNNYSKIDFSVYPSPTTGIIHIHSETDITRIVIYNLLGQLVLSSDQATTIDLSSLSQGVYVLKAFDDMGHVGNKRVLKI